MEKRSRRPTSRRSTDPTTPRAKDPATNLLRSIKAQHTITLRKVEDLEERLRSADPAPRQETTVEWFLKLIRWRW